jgi:hypothetical protein
MFTKKTVFILGAGASWHYGYPLGEGLVKKVIEKAALAIQFFSISAAVSNSDLPDFIIDTTEPNASLEVRWADALRDCQMLRAGLEQVNPLVIDYFLGWNPKLQTIGRLLIAWVILECEYVQLKNEGNANRKQLLINSPFYAERIKANDVELKRFKDDWCRFVIHQLAINGKTSSDIFKNDVRFVTFNYDISLERELHDGLQYIDLFDPADIDDFLDADRILHVYGKVREDPFAPPVPLNWNEQGRDPKGLGRQALKVHLSDYKVFLDRIYAASRGIRVIDPEDKETDKSVIETARKLI